MFLDRFCFLSEKGELAFDFVFPLVSSAIVVGSVHKSQRYTQSPKMLHLCLTKHSQFPNKFQCTVRRERAVGSTLREAWYHIMLAVCLGVTLDKTLSYKQHISRRPKKKIRTRNNIICKLRVFKWSQEWQMLFNEAKCKCLHIGHMYTPSMDFMKAFDKVPHMRLLIKLQSYGICSKTLDWIKAFLAGRHQRVVVNGQRSEWSEVTSGIPQGSVLGPLLFVMFINDLPKTVQCGIKLFADDTKVYVRSDIPGNPDCPQNDITLQDWSDKWLLNFHPDKCKVMHIGNHPPATNYTMRQSDNTTLDIRDEMTERDLGVAIDNHLNFKLHISQMVSQANRLLGMIRRSFEYLDQETFLYLYKGVKLSYRRQPDRRSQH